MRLDKIARVIRSKNAGPRKLTFDVMFDDPEHCEHVRRDLPKFRKIVAERFGIAENELTVIDYPPALAVKIVIDRAVMAGDVGDSDVYGAQQHAPLLGIEL